MKTWDTVTKDELIRKNTNGEDSIDADLQNQLNWTEYLRHLRDMLGMGMTADPMVTREHIQDVLIDIYMDMVNVMENRFPEPDEISTYIRGDYAQQTINRLTEIALQMTEENWSDFKMKICEEVGLDPDEF